MNISAVNPIFTLLTPFKDFYDLNLYLDPNFSFLNPKMTLETLTLLPSVQTKRRNKTLMITEPADRKNPEAVLSLEIFLFPFCFVLSFLCN